jgi:hypothetical protein
MTKSAIKYIHPIVGEIWIERSSLDYELLAKKHRTEEEQFKLDTNIQTEYSKCYGKHK